MTFNNFLQLIDNINQDFQIFCQIQDKNLPISKITVSANDFLAIPGQKAITKRKIIRLFNKMHNRGLSLFIFYQDKKMPVYGIQISLEKSQIILM